MIIRSALLVISLMLLSNTTFADIRYIYRDKLPNDPIIDAAYDFVKSVEPLVETWAPEWKYDVPKERIVNSFEEMLKDLREMVDKDTNQNNAELQVFIGLSAHYAYNIDVEDSYDMAMSAFQSAAKLSPNDYRPSWFIGEHLCQSASPAKGMSNLLQVEEKYPVSTLPEGFWADYLYCSNMAHMPMHGIRALKRVSETGLLNGAMQEFYQDIFSDRLKPTEPNQKYSYEDIWAATKQDNKMTFFNYAMGMLFITDENWDIQFSDLDNGKLAAIIKLPKVEGYNQPMVPNLMVMAESERPDKSFDDFKGAIIKDFKSTPASIEFCNRMDCEAYDVSSPFYPEEGGAHIFVIFIERSEPEFPGLILEYPQEPPNGSSGGMQYFRPIAKQTRIKGKIRYAIMLDSCVSIYPKAKEYFDLFLKTLVIE
jgi:hypothetical protein